MTEIARNPGKGQPLNLLHKVEGGVLLENAEKRVILWAGRF